MSEVMTEKKYKLTRKELGKLQPCIFLKRPGGCRNGGKCPFSHGTGESEGVNTMKDSRNLLSVLLFEVRSTALLLFNVLLYHVAIVFCFPLTYSSNTHDNLFRSLSLCHTMS